MVEGDASNGFNPVTPILLPLHELSSHGSMQEWNKEVN